jgi:hypothetical protein
VPIHGREVPGSMKWAENDVHAVYVVHKGVTSASLTPAYCVIGAPPPL